MEKIGIFARKNQVSSRTLHYYDEIGLLIPLRVNGVRMYSDDDATLLKRIIMLKDLGFSLIEISGFIKGGVSLEIIKTRRNELILMRDSLDETISKLDGLGLDSSLDSYDNPIGVSIRKVLGDNVVNEMFDANDINPNAYSEHLSTIMQSLKDKIDDDGFLLKEVKRYYEYYTDALHLDITKMAFEVIVSDNLHHLTMLNSTEKKRLLNSVRVFVEM